MARPPQMVPDPPDGTTVARPKMDPGSAPAATYVLVAIEGPDTGLRVTLDGTQASRLLVGAGPACDVRLADREVSRRHVALELRGRQLHVCDLGSTNGTFVDTVAVLEAYLQAGNVLRLGGSVFRVELTAPATVVPVANATGFGRVVGGSAAMRRLYPLCTRLAASAMSVVLEGETGTGKELLAESLHEEGPRAQGPFVVFDCTAVPPNLVESELFGHERGAFNEATSERKGVFEQANGGTLLIDEIGDLDLALQPKLLRVVERSEVKRVGGNHAMPVDVRVLWATRRNLDLEVQAGRFRDDLFHRIAGARIELPPLRRRREDIRVLALHLCRQLGGSDSTLPEHLLSRWEDYEWPGNVRELRNAVARHMTLGELDASDAVETSPLDPLVPGVAGQGVLERLLEKDLAYTSARQHLLDEFERRYVERVLAQQHGSVARAAAASGVARRHFQRVKARSAR